MGNLIRHNRGAKASSGDIICSDRGAPLIGAPPATVRCSRGHPVEEGKTQCSWCGEELPRPTRAVPSASAPRTLFGPPGGVSAAERASQRPLEGAGDKGRDTVVVPTASAPRTLFGPPDGVSAAGRASQRPLEGAGDKGRDTVVVPTASVPNTLPGPPGGAFPAGRAPKLSQPGARGGAGGAPGSAPLTPSGEGTPIAPLGGGNLQDLYLAGFLVSYTLDPKGAFLPLYEGLRNTVGIPAAWSATADQFLSPKPAVISCHQGEFVLEDRLSNHGIHVNGPEAIGAIRLENGNEIRLGGHVFILVAIPRG